MKTNDTNVNPVSISVENCQQAKGIENAWKKGRKKGERSREGKPEGREGDREGRREAGSNEFMKTELVCITSVLGRVGCGEGEDW